MEGLKRDIYHELATHKVVKKEERNEITGIFDGWSYTFGCYRLDYIIHNADTYIRMNKFNPNNKNFVIISNMGWDDDYPKNTTYDIYVAVENKVEGKPYIDPYKMPIKDTIKDSQKRFTKQMAEYAANFLPYNTPKKLRQKIVTQMKQVLTKNLIEHYNGKNR